jgi:hypothetical protein
MSGAPQELGTAILGTIIADRCEGDRLHQWEPGILPGDKYVKTCAVCGGLRSIERAEFDRLLRPSKRKSMYDAERAAAEAEERYVIRRPLFFFFAPLASETALRQLRVIPAREIARRQRIEPYVFVNHWEIAERQERRRQEIAIASGSARKHPNPPRRKIAGGDAYLEMRGEL